MDDDGVAVTNEAEQRLELGPLGVFTRDAVGEGLVELDAVELPVEVLVQAADPRVADPLTGDGVLQLKVSGWNLGTSRAGVNQCRSTPYPDASARWS